MARKFKQITDKEDRRYREAYEIGRRQFLAGEPPLWPHELWGKYELCMAHSDGYEHERKRAKVTIAEAMERKK